MLPVMSRERSVRNLHAQAGVSQPLGSGGHVRSAFALGQTDHDHHIAYPESRDSQTGATPRRSRRVRSVRRRYRRGVPGCTA